MKRTQLQLEDDLYNTLRERAFREHASVAGIIRSMLREQTRPGVLCRTPKKKIQDFSFIGTGTARGKGRKDISERHDEELIRAYGVC